MRKVQQMGCAETVVPIIQNGTANYINNLTRPLKYWIEEDRAQSFREGRWRKDFIDTSKLARYGFYFLCEPDYTRCYFCQLTIHDWQRDDEIIATVVHFCVED